MKALELIRELEKMVSERGNLLVCFETIEDGDIPVTNIVVEPKSMYFNLPERISLS